MSRLTRLVLLMTALAIVSVTAVDLKTCKANIEARLKNTSLPDNDPIFFHKANPTNPRNITSDFALTIEGCEATCPKPNFDLYEDMWPRLLTWLIPALLLIGSVHLPRVGSLNRFFVIIHFLGDPIDSMWSLATKAEVWNRFYRIALEHAPPVMRRRESRVIPGKERVRRDNDAQARALAAMLSAFEELTGDMNDVDEELRQILTESGTRLSAQDIDYILLETADELVDSRSNEVLRTGLVIINYLWAVLAALVPEIGGLQSSQPGGRIGTAMFLSWLVTAVLLSNTLSGFTSRRTCLRIMERYYRALQGRKRDVHFFPNSPRLVARASWLFQKKRGIQDALTEDFIDSQPWNGSVYSYRTRKRLISSKSKDDWSPAALLFLAASPILVSSICSFVIIYFTPTIGLGCRTLWVIGLTVGLLLSPLMTWSITKMAGGKFAWYLTIAKDSIIASAIVFVIILSSIGIFNTCWCWSGVYSRGRSNAYIDLDPSNERDHNMHGLYPAVVGACLGLQILIFVIMLRIMRVGGRVFRPDEDDKMEAYRRIHGLSSSPEDNLNNIELTSTPPDTQSRTAAKPPSWYVNSISPRQRHDSQATDDGAFLLSEPAVDIGTAPVYLQESARLYHEQTTAGSASRGPVRSAEFGYGVSPEWRSSEQPLLGSPPPLPRRPM